MNREEGKKKHTGGRRVRVCVSERFMHDLVPCYIHCTLLYMYYIFMQKSTVLLMNSQLQNVQRPGSAATASSSSV